MLCIFRTHKNIENSLSNTDQNVTDVNTVHYLLQYFLKIYP